MPPFTLYTSERRHYMKSIFLFYFFNQRIKCFYYIIISAFVHIKFSIMYRVICFFFDFCRKYDEYSFCIIKVVCCTVPGQKVFVYQPAVFVPNFTATFQCGVYKIFVFIIGGIGSFVISISIFTLYFSSICDAMSKIILYNL